MGKARGIAAALLGGLALLGCQFLIGLGVFTWMERHWPTPNALDAWFESARLQVGDLPFGWHYAGTRVEYAPGAEARAFWFYGPAGAQTPWINVLQEIYRYPSADAARQAYPRWVDTYIPPHARAEWIRPPGLTFTPQADQMEVACLSAYINRIHHYACRAIGRYGNVVGVLLANVFDERWLTMADFQKALEAMDRRLIAAQGRQP